jgi:hypothetical protein
MVFLALSSYQGDNAKESSFYCFKLMSRQTAKNLFLKEYKIFLNFYFIINNQIINNL